MSISHKGSRLALEGQVIATAFNSFHASYSIDASAINCGNIIESDADNVYTMRPNEGKFSGGILIEQDTVNEFIFPTFETTESSGGWSHWAQAGGIGAYGQNTNSAYIYDKEQTYSHWVSNDISATGDYVMYQVPDFLGGLRSLQCIVCLEGSSEVIGSTQVYPVWNADSVEGTAINFQWTSVERIGNSHFYLCKCEGIGQDGSNDLVGIYVRAGIKAYFSQVQLEQKPFATSFVDGTRSTGKSWYSKELFNHSKTTLSMWFNIPYMHRSDIGNAGIQGNWYHPIIEFAPETNIAGSYYSLACGPEPSSWNRKLIQLSPSNTGNTGIAIQDKTWYHLAVTIDGPIITTYINGMQELKTTSTSIDNGDYVLMVGGGFRGKSNIIVSDLYIDNGAVHSSEEVESWYISEKPFYNPWDYRSYSY